MRTWFLIIGLILALAAGQHPAFAAPATIDTSSSAQATSNSAQRKTFYDTLNSRHWAFYYNGTAIECSYSPDGTTWTSAGTLAYNTASFSAIYKTIGGTSYVFVVAEANDYDVVLRRGELGATAVNFDAEITVFDGSGDDDKYTKPTAAISENNHLWVSSIKDHGVGRVERFHVEVRRSTNLANGNLAALNAEAPVGRRISALENAVLMPRDGDELYLIISADDGNVVGYAFDGVNWSAANAGGDYSWFGFGTSGVNGVVLAIAISDDDIYIGGNFTSVGGVAKTIRIARWDGSNWLPLGDGLNGAVSAIDISGDDIYVAGSFTDAGGVAEADYVARWDGSNWNALGSGLGNVVRDMKVSGNDVYVGGQFLNAGGIAEADYVARWDGNSWHALGSGPTSTVMAIAISGTDVYVGGSFANVAGIPAADNIARWDGNNWSALGSGLNSNVYDIAISGSDIYVGGDFGSAGGIPEASFIARWDGNSWHALGDGVDGPVFAIGISGSDVYVGGDFLEAVGVPNTTYIARWDGVTWHEVGGGLYGHPQVIVASGGDVYIGGDFSDAGGQAAADHIARWDGSNWNAFAGAGGIAGPVWDMKLFGGDLYVAGEFTNVGGIEEADNIARWDGNSWHALGSGLDNSVYALAVLGGDIYAGGFFTNGGGVAGANHVARWDGNSWNALGTGPGGFVTALAVSGTDLFVGGSFLDAGGVAAADRIARWDGNNWFALGNGLNSLPWAIEILENDIYVGGNFTDGGGVAEADYIARWDGNNWFALGNGLNNNVFSIKASDGDLFVGGSFVNAGGIAEADRIARWDGNNWHALGDGLNNTVEALLISGSDIYVGGDFTDAGGIAEADRLARWDGSNWYAVGGGLADTVYAIAQSATNLFAGGDIFEKTNLSLTSPLVYYAPAIATDADSDTELSALSDPDGNIHLSYTNSDGELRFRSFDDDSSSWQATVNLNGAASSSPALARKGDTGKLVASWIEGSEVKYSHASAPYQAADWSAAATLYGVGINNHLSAAAEISSDIHLLLWINGVGAPYGVFADQLNMAVPVVAISSTATNPTKFSPIPVTVQFSKQVTGFVIGDIAVTNGTAGNFVAVDGRTYTADILPTAEGEVTVDVAASVAKDEFDNDNDAATQFSITYDTTSSTLVISSSETSPTNASPIPVTFEFDEDVTGFAVGDITVTNGSKSSFVAVDGNTYTADITPSGQGAVTVDVAAAAAEDAAGNESSAAVQFSITYDSVVPTAAITSTASSPTETSLIPIVIEFSENISGFAVGDIAVANGSVGNFAAATGNRYTVNVSAAAGGNVTVTVAAAAVTDTAGNANPAVQFTIVYQPQAENDDSDGDGVGDDQEEEDGTNPEDPGSVVTELETHWCSDWNGYLGMYNINEYVNLSSSRRSVVTTLFDIDGAARSAFGFSVAGKNQIDLLTHEMSGWKQQSYGMICSDVTNGQPGDVDGRMVYYKPNETGYDFAFALPYVGGLKGSQFVSFNNIQPSQESLDAGNLVGNWIQITNLEQGSQTGTLIFYALDGTVIASEAIDIWPEARRDYSAHHLGAVHAGIVEWRPSNSDAKFVLRNTKYYYDNPEMRDSFDAAVLLDGMKGNGETLSVLLDTRQQVAILEISNVTASPLDIMVKVYNAAGAVVMSELLDDLPGYATRHLVVNGLLNDELGSAAINGSAPGSVVAVAMHYGKANPTGPFTIGHAYGINAKQALGTVVNGSYNTFLGQDCELLLVNSSKDSVVSTVEMTRLDGLEVLANHLITTPGKGASSFDLCAAEEADQYGVVTVTAGARNAITPLIIRKGANGDYRFVTPVR